MPLPNREANNDADDHQMDEENPCDDTSHRMDLGLNTKLSRLLDDDEAQLTTMSIHESSGHGAIMFKNFQVHPAYQASTWNFACKVLDKTGELLLSRLSPVLLQRLQRPGHILGQRGREFQGIPFQRVGKSQGMGVQGLAGNKDGGRIVRQG